MKKFVSALLFLVAPAVHALNFGGSSGASSVAIPSTVTVSAVAGQSTSLTLQAAGSNVVVITTTAGNGKLLLPNATLSERPSIASQGFPTTGLSLNNTSVDIILGNTVTHQFHRSGDGYFNFTPMGSSRKDGDGHLYPTIHSEINHDGINFVDNRLPDGTVGHDSTGRFIDHEIAGAGKFRVGVSSAGFFTGTSTLGGRVAIGSSNAQFVIDGSTATGSGTVGFGTASPAATSTSPVWVKFRLCNTSGSSCSNYYMPMWAE